MGKLSALRSVAIGFTAGFMALHGMGCAASKQGTNAALRADAAELFGKRTTTGTLTNIDPQNRVVVLNEADGGRSIVAVADHIIFGRMEIGDRVRVDRKGLFGFEMLEPGQIIDDKEFSHEALPAGVTFGRRLATTVEILKVADQGGSAIVLSKDGSRRKLKATTADKRTTLARLRPGDQVAASCTEKLSIDLKR